MVSTRQHRSKSSKAKSLEVAESSDSDFIPTSPSRTAKMAQRSPFGAAPVAPFIIKTYEMVNDPATDHIISWTPDGASFTVTSTETFSKELLPRHFKHNNFSSFVRQLNTYRFRKIDPESWTFKNEYFVRGRPDQLGLIVRKTTDGPKAKGGGKSPASSIQPALEVGAYGGYGTSSVDAVRRDNALLRQEVIRLRHEPRPALAHDRLLGLDEVDVGAHAHPPCALPQLRGWRQLQLRRRAQLHEGRKGAHRQEARALRIERSPHAPQQRLVAERLFARHRGKLGP